MLRVRGERHVRHPSLAGVVQLRLQEKSEVFQIFAVWSAELVTIMLGGLGIQGGRNIFEAIIRNFCLVELIPWWLE